MDDRIFKNLPLKNLIFEHFENPLIFFDKIRDILFCFTMYTKRKC